MAAMTLGAAAEMEPKKGRNVRFLALGELPPFRQEIRDNIRYELEPPPGSIPPREVLLGYGGETTEAIQLRLGLISQPLQVPAGVGPLLLSRRGDTKDSEPWLRLDRPDAGDFLVLIWRASRTGTWEKVSSLVVADDLVSAPAGSVRFINISHAPVGIIYGTEKLILGARKMFRRPVPVGKEQTFEVLLTETAGTLKRLHAGNVMQNPGERSLVLIYLADGAAHRRPLKVVVQRELAALAP